MGNWALDKWNALYQENEDSMVGLITLLAILSILFSSLAALVFMSGKTDRELELDRLKIELEIKQTEEALND